MKRVLFTLWFVIIAMSLYAQTITTHVQWDQSEPLATVQTFQYTLKDNALAPVILTPICVVSGSGAHCSASIPALPSGVHTLVLTAYNGIASLPATLTANPPSTPTGVSLTFTITIP